MVYILNRDAAARLTISSPLEAHKSHTLVYHTVGVDVGFENPMFACLEMDYEVQIIINIYNHNHMILLSQYIIIIAFGNGKIVKQRDWPRVAKNLFRLEHQHSSSSICF